MKRRWRLLLWTVAVLIVNLSWYASYLSFPLFGEDGAALYSFLVETVKYGWTWKPLFPVKWLEGLGQPNLFMTIFDPFSWLMLSGLSHDDAMRISYALRATVCWLATYMFARWLFRSVYGGRIISALLGMLVSFTLTHPAGIPTFAGIFVATHAAMFPWLLWLYSRAAYQGRGVGWADAALVPLLVLFLVVYPLGSLLGLVVLFVFALSVTIVACPADRGATGFALLKLAAVATVVLLVPRFGLFWAWSSVSTISARYVFAAELTSYGHAYSAPLLWHDVPVGLRVVVLLALSAVLLDRWPRPLRACALSAALVVVGSQAVTLARANGVMPGVIERLPRAFYLEYYLPTFYAVIAAYALCRWRQIVFGVERMRLWWLLRMASVVGCAVVLLGVWTALGLVALFLAANGVVRSGKWNAGQCLLRRARAAIPAATLAALFAGAAATWLVWPEGVHPLFFGELTCRRRVIWCRDAAGASMGAGANAITDFLRSKLEISDVFRGRAEFVLIPSPRLVGFPVKSPEVVAPQEFETFRGWYARAYEYQRSLFPSASFPRVQTYFSASFFDRAPDEFNYGRRRELVETLDRLARSGDPTLGVLPDEVMTEIVAWTSRHPAAAVPARFSPAWDKNAEVTVMVQERNRNFLQTGNGMLLRALPYNGVPVASAYEQALDYLYYLFWTRYVNEGVPVQRSINFTSLEMVRPERLALIGVRYVIGRDAALRGEMIDLPRVFSWRGYSVYEIPGTNLAGYAARRVVSGVDLTAELSAMRDSQFDPRSTVVVPESEGSKVLAGSWLAGLTASRLTIRGQSLRFEARSDGGRALVVLPFKFSNCWRARWKGHEGRIVRSDGALIGVVFDDATDVRLTWSAGYGRLAECFRQDATLVGRAVAAAAALR